MWQSSLSSHFIYPHKDFIINIRLKLLEIALSENDTTEL